MTWGINGFQPDRLLQVLRVRRLTQVQLAGLIGVVPSTVSRWCKKGQAPEPLALERLASVVNVAPEWFTRPVFTSLSRPLFRSNAAAHSNARACLSARLEWTEDIVASLGDFVDFPNVTVPSIDTTSVYNISNQDIEDAAIACRKRLGFGDGPVPDLALAVESAGVILVREMTGIVAIEGVSAWSKAIGRPFILLSSDKANGYRSRFDLAHELGHLVLHRNIDLNATDKLGYDLMELQAHRFAGAFLLPAERLAAEVKTPVTLDSLVYLKHRWGASVAAIVMRLTSLNIIDAAEKQLLFKRRSSRWGAKSEPGDDQRALELPRLLKRTIDLLASSGVLPLESVASHLGMSQHDVESLVGLPSGYLSGRNRVLDLATLRPEYNRTLPLSIEGIEHGKVFQFPHKRR